MNLERIYSAVEEDEMNSALITICDELVKQRYKVFVEGVEFTNDEGFNELLIDLEENVSEINFKIIKSNFAERFKLVFTDYHKFELKE